MTSEPNPTYQPPAAPMGPVAPAGPKRLVRNPQDKMLGGVCSGLADYLGLDVTLVRVLTVLAAVLGLGSIVVAYLVAWVIVPDH